MSHAVHDHDTTVHRGSLLRAELHRFRTRRLVRGLLLAGLFVFVASAVLAFTHFARPGTADLAAANGRIDQSVAQQVGLRATCLNQEAAAARTVENHCGPEVDRSSYRVTNYLATPPFELDVQYFDGALLAGVGAAALSFVVGATFVGAEWSQRSLVALLFWAPRRGVVISRKLAVATMGGAVIGLALVLGWFGLAHLLGALRGSSDVADGFYAAALGQGGRLVALSTLAGLAGAALANLVRGSGAALGLAFSYVVVVETAVRKLTDTGRQWLLSTAVQAMGNRDGARFYVDAPVVMPNGSIAYNVEEFLVSGAHGAVVLGVAVAVVVAAGSLLFLRRDLQ